MHPKNYDESQIFVQKFNFDENAETAKINHFDRKITNHFPKKNQGFLKYFHHFESIDKNWAFGTVCPKVS